MPRFAGTDGRIVHLLLTTLRKLGTAPIAEGYRMRAPPACFVRKLRVSHKDIDAVIGRV
jgi:hypothetical protein